MNEEAAKVKKWKEGGKDRVRVVESRYRRRVGKRAGE